MDKEALLRMLSSKVKAAAVQDATEIANALDNAAGEKDPKRLSGGKKSNSAPRLIISEEEENNKKARSKDRSERKRLEESSGSEVRVYYPKRCRSL